MHSRLKVGAGKGRRVFDAIVARHVLRNDCDHIIWVCGQKQCRREARDASTVDVSYVLRAFVIRNQSCVVLTQELQCEQS